MKNMKRLLSLLLVLVMLVGLLPNLAFESRAAEETPTPLDALVVISDLHIGTSGTSETNKATLLKNVLTKIRDSVGTVSSVNSAGDMFSSNKGTVTSDTNKLNGYIREIFPNVPVNYTWTDHDRNASSISKKSFLTVYDNYYIYNLSMGDLCSNDRYTTGFAYTESNNTNRVNKGFTATVPQAIADFQNAVKDLDKNKPLFIVGHQPLFDNRNDNAWAEDWVAAINTVAATMDVTYFFGHNHNYDLEYSNSDYYYAKGSSMPVPKRSDWGFNYYVGEQKYPELGSNSVTINFTHICAGYLDPATGSGNSNTRKGTAVGVKIYGDHITYTAYDKNGVYDSSKTALELDVEVERKNKVTNEGGSGEGSGDSGLTVNEMTKNGVTVKALGLSALDVAAVTSGAAFDAAALRLEEGFVAYDIDATYAGGTGTVTMPLPTGVTDPTVFYVADDGKTLEQKNVTAVAGDKVTFETDHFSTYAVGKAVTNTNVGESITITGGAEPKSVYVLVNKLEAGGEYLIVSEGKTHALSNVNNEAGSTTVSVINSTATVGKDSFSEYIEVADSSAIWVATKDGAGVNLKNGTRYIRGRDGDLLSSTKSVWTYNNNKMTSSGYQVTYSNGNWTNNKNGSVVYLYKKVSATVSADVTYTVNAANVSHNIVEGGEMTKQMHFALLGNGTAVDASKLNATASVEVTSGSDIISVNNQGLITFSGNPGQATVRVSYTWTVGTETYQVYKDVEVTAKTPSNYPEFANEGAVRVNKSGTGINFQSTGLARIEVSAAGIPMNRGIDIIVMLDMSSSMDKCIGCGAYLNVYSSKNRENHDANCAYKDKKVTRVDELRDAMKDLKAALTSSDAADSIRIAVADFNGFYTSDTDKNNSAYYLDTSDRSQDKACLTNTSHARVFTGTGLNADAFIHPSELDIDAYFSAANGNISHSGTNYDYAFDAIYQLGHAIKQENGDNQRELYVLFMSDGAPNQFNYYGTTGGNNGSTDWNYWLTGNIGTGTGKQSMTATVANTHTYYYDEATGNQHRMANAVKGDPEMEYQVIRKNQMNARGQWTKTDDVTDLLEPIDREAKPNLYNLEGLGATMYSMAFYVTNDGKITEDSAKHVLQQIPSSPELYFDASKEGDLQKAFNSFATDVLYAAENARFVDQMGKNYNLPLGALRDLNGNLIDASGKATTDSTKALANTIEIVSYEIYTLEDFQKDVENNKETDRSKIGSRKLDADGHPITKVIETVTIHADGTVTSNLIDGGNTNILATMNDGTHVKGVIYAKNFYYNTNTYDVTPNGINIPTGIGSNNLTTGSSNVLPGETFYWNMGTVKTTELAMRYYVYLDGSMEGHREAGSYATNEFAILYYDNYLDNPCYKETVSPVLAWKSANVSYAFYLVNDKGEVIKNQTTGATGTFADRIAITNPVVFDEILLNDEGAFLDVVTASEVLPDYYVPFDGAASYLVDANSDGTGSWIITGGKVIDGNTVYTTYVTGYDLKNAAAYTYEPEVSDNLHDYTHTTVWFAVELVTQAHPDTVVVDYGLPVEISVLANDMFGENGKLAGVGAITDSLNLNGHDTNLASGFNGYKSDFGTATANVNTGKVTYTPSNMQMNTYDKFAYAVNYTGSVNPCYYYDTVTVIPATTIYYEDSFLDYTYYVTDDEGNVTDRINDIVTPAGESKSGWQLEGTTVDAVQGEDRPGKYSITDANNIYGYDGVNKSMSTHSLGSAAKAYVNSTSYATAAFTFYGTGFDIISMTSNTTGVLAVKVTAAEDIGGYKQGDKVKATMINTYYGCSYEQLKDAEGNPMVDEDGKAVMGWVSKPNVDQAMYQVPIMQIEELPYGKYDVLMTATYNSALDEDDEDGYWLYLDAVRIYDPANDGASDDVLHHVTYTYNADSKKWVRTVGDRAASDAIPTDAVFPKDPTNGMTVTAIENIETTIEDAYKQDGEGWPSYIELRNKLISADSFGENVTTTGEVINGLVFIDGDPSVGIDKISDYQSYGPNNEVYLKSGQSVAFRLSNITDNVANIHIGIKSADGKIGKYAIKNVASADISTSITAGTAYGEKSFTVDTSTDMYYDLSAWKNDIIVISNTGAETDGIISITNIKATYNADPNGTLLTGEDDDTNKVKSVDPINNEVDVFMTYESANLTLRAINGVADQKPDAPQPEDPKPEDPKPEEPKPEEPEVFDPEVTVTVNKDSVKVKQSVQVKVYTDSDVASVEVNGNMITKYSVEKKTGRRIWSTYVTAIEAGELEIEVVASNAEGVKAEPVVKTVTVTEKNNGNGNNGNAGNKPNANNKPVTGIPGSNAMSNFLNNIMNLFKNFWRR